jgi:ABC-type uncharacterized transport system ATPase component
VEEKNIEIPGGNITGPDLSLENKDFITIITINNFDKVSTLFRQCQGSVYRKENHIDIISAASF